MRIQIIINPKVNNGIDGIALRKSIVALANDSTKIDCRFVATTKPGEATALSKKAIENGVSRIVAVGGDGTVNEIINGMRGSNASLAIIPTGGANDLASYLGIPKSTEEACRVAVGGTSGSIDLIRVNDRYFATVGGLGFGSEVALKTNKFKSSKRSGKFAYSIFKSDIYTLYAVFQIVFRSEIKGRFKLDYGNTLYHVNLWNLFISNQPSLGKNFLISPSASNTDGVLDICMISQLNSKIKQFKTLLAVMKGKHIYLDSVGISRASRISIDCDKPVAFFGDGELISYGSSFDIEVVPGALSVVVPKAELNIASKVDSDGGDREDLLSNPYDERPDIAMPEVK